MPYLPSFLASGGAIRVYHMLKILSQHEVTVLAFGSADEVHHLRKKIDLRLQDVRVVPRPWPARSNIEKRLGQFLALGTRRSFNHLSVQSLQMQSMIDRLLCENDYDVIQCEFSIMGSFCLNTGAVKVLDMHDLEHDRIRQMEGYARSPLRKLYYLREQKKVLEEEIEACSRQDAVFVTSENDKVLLDNAVPAIPKIVIPNGVDTAYFTPSIQVSEPASLVFSGLMSYIPNSDGILYFLDSVFPLVEREVPNVRVYIVGGQPPKKLRARASDRVIVTGYVEDIRPYVWRSSVYVVPLRMGSGTRLKILEAMAMKKPVVSTSVGCRGLKVRNGESILIADEPEAFAQAVVQLMRSSALRRKLAQNGYELAQALYEWSVIGRQVEEAYQSLVSSTRKRVDTGVFSSGFSLVTR